ncbi:AraC family transcriptional regulator [Dyella sp.]|uniref:helix-turn-helix transcriptional regulator n=1 Tax=Dyella sp. TaxID=1869338 RepID=UPI002ED2200B
MAPAMRTHISSYMPGQQLKPHVHGEAWLCLVLDGHYREQIRSRRDEHGAGDLLFCPAHEMHSQVIGATGAHKLLFSPPQASLDYLFEQGVRLHEAPYLPASPELVSAGQRMRRELCVGDRFASLALEGMAMELLVALARCGGRDEPQPPLWLRRLRENLDDEPGMAWTFDMLAHDAARHPVHVARSFRQWYGCTVGEYLRRARVEQAARLLRQGNLPLLEIALHCGFAGAAPFARTFKAVFGVSPSTYRRASR